MVTRRLVPVMDVRLRFEEWRRRRAAGVAQNFIDYLVEHGTIDAATKQRVVLEMAMSSGDPDAQAEEKIRTMVLGGAPARTPAPTPPATTPAPQVRSTSSGRLVPIDPQRLGEIPGHSTSRRLRRPSGLTSSHTPGSNTPGPGPEEGEVELLTPGGIPIGIEPPVGTRLGAYELLEVIGRGGMGTVFKARVHPSLEIVAVKVLGGSDRKPSPARRARFRREILATTRLGHENIVRVRDAGHAAAPGGPGIEFMVMELVEGDDLEKALASGRLSLDQRVAIAAQVIAGVAHAHERGVIHRDLKTQNVLLDANGVPKVVDFGLAKIEEEDNRLTRTGSALGTPFYMAPEQFTGASAVDARADVFSLGVLLYELMTLDRPFKGANAVEIADHVRNLDPTPPSLVLPGISKKLDAVVARALEKKPDGRYANAGELLADLEKARAGGDVQARAPGATRKIVKAASSYRAPAIGFLVACLVFLPVIVFLTRGGKGDGAGGSGGTSTGGTTGGATGTGTGETGTGTGTGTATSATGTTVAPPRPPVEPLAQSAIDKARAEIDAVAAAGALDLPGGADEASSALLELEPAFFAPVAVGDVARARAGLSTVKAIAPDLRAELLRELALLERLRALVLCLARLDPGALGDRIDAWGGARDLGRYPRVLEDETIEVRVEDHSACVRPLALSTETLARATGGDPRAARALAVLSVARGEVLPPGVPERDGGALRALASWREGARPIARSFRERLARSEWQTMLKDGDPEAWATRFSDTAFFSEQRRAWTLFVAERLGAEKLLAASLDSTKNKLLWDGAEANLLAFDVAFVATTVRVERSAVGLDLAGVRLRLDAGRARAASAALDDVSGRVAFALGRHAIAIDERGHPSASVAGVAVGEDAATARWGQARRLDATFHEHDPTKVLEVGPPVVIFKLDGLRLAKVPLDAAAPPATATLELTLERGRLRALEVVSMRGALEAALPRLADAKLARLADRRAESGRVLRDETDRLAGLRLEGPPGTWKLGPDGALEATGPARLVSLVAVETGAALLAVDATPGVTLGWGEPSSPAPVTAKGTFKKLSVVATASGDALTVDELLRVPFPRTKGPRSFVVRVDAGARVAVRGLKLLAD